MPYNRRQVSAFLTKAELELFESSLADRRESLATAVLQRRIQRTRSLRDKNRDLLQRQRLVTQARTGSKMGVSGHANERTKQKSVAFDEALKRFEQEATRRATRDQDGGTDGHAPAEALLAEPALKGLTDKPNRAPGRPTAAAPIPARVVLSKALEVKQASVQAHVEAARSRRSPKASAASAAEPLDRSDASRPDINGAATASRFVDADLLRTQGHTSTQERRGQAKRDHRA